MQYMFLKNVFYQFHAMVLRQKRFGWESRHEQRGYIEILARFHKPLFCVLLDKGQCPFCQIEATWGLKSKSALPSNKYYFNYIERENANTNKVIFEFCYILDYVRWYKIALNLGAGHVLLLISLYKSLEISSCARPAPRFRAILYRQTIQSL